MRHRKRGRKLGRTTSHRKALSRNLLNSLFEHGQVTTTLAKAKNYAPMADKLVTLAKRAETKIQQLRNKYEAEGEITSEIEKKLEAEGKAIRLAYYRRALTKLRDKKVVHKIFFELAPLYADRQGGYTSILRLNKPRLGDNAPQAILKLVAKLPEIDEKAKEREEKKAEKEKRKQKKQKEKERKEKKAKKEKEKK